MTDDQPGDSFTHLLMLLFERATTLSVQVEALRVLLEARGVFSSAEFDQQTAELRTRWELPQHPHASLSQELTPADYVARIRRLLTPRPGDDPPSAGAA